MGKAEGAEPQIPVLVTSAYGARTKRGFVQLQVGDEKWQFSSAEARRIAGLLIECAEAADQDAFLMVFLQQRVGLDEPRSAQVMGEYRKWRELGDVRSA